MEELLELRVHKVVQTASGGSHVTIYEAELTLLDGSVQVEIVAVDPPDADSIAVEAARDAIQRGAAAALQPYNKGAIIRVEHIVIHPVDFWARRFEQYTVEAVRQLLAQPT
jgi:hypothetical protein